MPMNKALYPANWPEISAALKEQVGQKCEQCGLENYRWIYRNKFKPEQYIYVIDTGGDGDKCDEFYRHRTEYPSKPHQVILTTAHLDHNPANNDRSNLRVLCQRCHLVHDLPHHMANARQTRIRKKHAAKANAGQVSLFEGKES